jgi:predicted Fe-Mo cluster-binding NifX family protein
MVNKMKIGLPSNGSDLSAGFAAHFGRCQHFLIYDTDNNELLNSFPNSARNASGGAGIQAAQELVNEKVEVVIAPQIGPNAWDVLQVAKIRIYIGINGTVQDNITAFKNGELNEMTVAQGIGPGMGRGRGMGRGMGQGRGKER